MSRSYEDNFEITTNATCCHLLVMPIKVEYLKIAAVPRTL